MGVRGITHKWFESYLQNGEQYEIQSFNYQNIQQMLNSIPQGSVTGCRLFVIYINEFT